ncbi:MAG: Smr/MutS family protein [Spirochaetales bacterium]|nr:Smr/MutS family protein [Spirochaetales bacterium]
MDFEKLIDLYPPEASGKDEEPQRYDLRDGKKVSRMKHQAELDLHGYTAENAVKEVEVFLEKAFRDGLLKVLIIYGKGYHSEGKAVLSGVVRKCLEASPLAGKLLVPPAKYGGSGALWVMIRRS